MRKHDLKPLKLNLFTRALHAREHRIHRGRWVLYGVAKPARIGPQKCPDRLWLFGLEFRARQDRGAVKRKTIIGEQKRHDIFDQHAAILEIDKGRERTADNGIHFARRQHRCAHLRPDIQDCHLRNVDAAEPGKERPNLHRRIEARRAEFTAFEIFRHNARRGFCGQRSRRPAYRE